MRSTPASIKKYVFIRETFAELFKVSDVRFADSEYYDDSSIFNESPAKTEKIYNLLIDALTDKSSNVCFLYFVQYVNGQPRPNNIAIHASLGFNDVAKQAFAIKKVIPANDFVLKGWGMNIHFDGQTVIIVA